MFQCTKFKENIFFLSTEKSLDKTIGAPSTNAYITTIAMTTTRVTVQVSICIFKLQATQISTVASQCITGLAL